MSVATITGNRLFRLGNLRITPGAKDEFEKTGESPVNFIRRHQTGDWITVWLFAFFAGCEIAVFP
jgi:hypothetical protein